MASDGSVVIIGGNRGIGVMKADEGELVRMVRHLANNAIRVGVPHAEHSQPEGHGRLLSQG